MTLILPITLTAAAVAALINIWIAIRVGAVRRSAGVSIGDGGNESLTARMRAHANFAEYTPIVLILIGALEMVVGTNLWLWAIAAGYLLGRVLHPFGMDGMRGARAAGTMLSMLATLALAVWAIFVASTGAGTVQPRTEIVRPG